MTYRRYIFVLWALALSPTDARGHHASTNVSADPRSSLDTGGALENPRYDDLRHDVYAMRVLNVFLDRSVHHGGVVFTGQKQQEIEWYRQQGEKAYPILIEVFKRENDVPTEGLWIKDRVLSYFLTRGGDKQALVNEVRRQLPKWQDIHYDHGSHAPFVFKSIGLLSKEGDASDIPLIEGFLDNPNLSIRNKCARYLKAMEERLAAEAAAGQHSETPGERAAGTFGTEGGDSENAEQRAERSRGTGWLLPLIGALATVGALSILVRARLRRR